MLTVDAVLQRNHRYHRDALALVDARGRIDHGTLAQRAWAVGRGLLRRGVRPGDRVGLLADNGIFGTECFLGIASIGAVATMYNWRWATPELVFALNQSGASTVFVDRRFESDLEAALASGDVERRPAVIVEGKGHEALLDPGAAPEVGVGEDDPLAMIYTGGTTGFPKGVLLSHGNAVANALNEIVDTDMEPSDRTLILTPMFHSASLLCWFLPHLMLGAASVFAPRFDEAEVAVTIAREGITNAFLVPSMVRRMARAGALERCAGTAFSRLYVGGAAFMMEDKEMVREAVPKVRMYYQYGLSEAGPIVTRLRPEDMFRPELDGSIGKPFLLTQVSLRDAADAPVPIGETGEICVRGPNVMLGYHDAPEATAEALRGGWLRTGDLAGSDADGYLFFRDRSKDMIKSGGENVHSAEVEQVLYLHPAVAEAAVLGVKSGEWDEEVCAVVALAPGRSAEPDELRAHCRAQLAGYKVPKRFAFIPATEMPLNQSGKILKRELAQRNLFA